MLEEDIKFVSKKVTPAKGSAGLMTQQSGQAVTVDGMASATGGMSGDILI